MFYSFDNIDNFRDLDGVEVADGRKLKSGLLFRCGELEKATNEDIQRLEALGVSAVIDFRDSMESQQRPDRLPDGAKYYSFPALPSFKETEKQMKEKTPGDMADQVFPQVYRDLASSEESTRAYRNFFNVLLESKGKPVLWHCRQGKDRTGVAAILLLTALGADRRTCLDEYFLTNEFMQKKYEEYSDLNKDEKRREIMKVLLFVRPDWLDEYLNIIDATGGLETYLRNRLMVTEEEINTLKSYYLE